MGHFRTQIIYTDPEQSAEGSPKRRGSGRFGGQEGAPASQQWGGARGRAKPRGSTGRSGELAEAGGCASTGDSTGKRSGVAVGVYVRHLRGCLQHISVAADEAKRFAGQSARAGGRHHRRSRRHPAA